MAAKLSVNVNKVATLRNSRGGNVPSLFDATEVILAAGAPGITIHPRADERHIRRADVVELAHALGRRRDTVELNIEGDPRPDLMDLVCELRPQQCTLVPVRAGELTSEAGWAASAGRELRPVIERLAVAGIRVSLFVDPDPDAVRWAADLGAQRVELYTEPFAAAFARGAAEGEESFVRFVRAAELAHTLQLGVNAGHDLDLRNLRLFCRLPHFAEASIGHALISHALFVGLHQAVRDFVDALIPKP
jgi:pyridoxine 5-phosphate synthase